MKNIKISFFKINGLFFFDERLFENRGSTAEKLILARFSDYFCRRACYSPQKIEKPDSK
jgi:hypothetical protein